jgi:type I restriction enzyme S subunit
MQYDSLLRALSTRAVNQVLLKKETVENIKVPLPSLFEQQKIVLGLLTIDQKLELEKNEKEKLQRVKQGMMDLLLSGKVRVKVEG